MFDSKPKNDLLERGDKFLKRNDLPWCILSARSSSAKFSSATRLLRLIFPFSYSDVPTVCDKKKPYLVFEQQLVTLKKSSVNAKLIRGS